MPTNRKVKFSLDKSSIGIHPYAHVHPRKGEKEEISGTTEARPTDACGWSGI